MTLLEIVMSVAILVIAAVSCLGYLMNQTRRTRLTAMEVAAQHALNGMASRLEDIGETAAETETIAYAIVNNFMGLLGENIAVGPNRTTLARAERDTAEGALVYRFWLPIPGSQLREETDSRFLPSNAGMGVMRIYLDENVLNSRILPAFEWKDLSSAPAGSSEGMDLNLNGSKTDSLLVSYADIKQLAANITVTYYTDESHAREAYSASRDLIIARIKDAAKDFDPTLP